MKEKKNVQIDLYFIIIYTLQYMYQNWGLGGGGGGCTLTCLTHNDRLYVCLSHQTKHHNFNQM